MYIKHSPERITIKGYERDDCTINAIGTALGLSYDLSRKILQTGIYYNGQFSFIKSNPRTKNEFIQRHHVKRICEALSVDRNIYISDKELLERKAKDSCRYNKENSLKKFADSNPKGVFIVLVHCHLVAIVNGQIIDTWDSSKREVEIAYRVDVDKAREMIAELAKYYKMDSDKHILEEHIDFILEKAS